MTLLPHEENAIRRLARYETLPVDDAGVSASIRLGMASLAVLNPETQTLTVTRAGRAYAARASW